MLADGSKDLNYYPDTRETSASVGGYGFSRGLFAWRVFGFSFLVFFFFSIVVFFRFNCLLTVSGAILGWF